MAPGPTPPPMPNFAMAFGSMAFLGVAGLATMAGHQPETVILRALMGAFMAAGVGALAGFVWGGVVAVGRDLHKGGEIDALVDEELNLSPPPAFRANEGPSPEGPELTLGPQAAQGPAPTPEAPAQGFAPIDYKQAAKQIQGMLKDGPGATGEG